MKTIVIHVQDEVCVANGRDPEATSLIEKARTFGKVESGDSFLATERAKYQATIDSLTRQLDEIKEFGVTPAELEILRAVRKKSAEEASAHLAREKALSEKMQRDAADLEQKAQQIRAILGL